MSSETNRAAEIHLKTEIGPILESLFELEKECHVIRCLVAEILSDLIQKSILETVSGSFGDILTEKLLRSFDPSERFVWRPVFSRSVAKLFCQNLSRSESGKGPVLFRDLVSHPDPEVVSETFRFLIGNVENVSPEVLMAILNRVSTETDAARLKASFDVCSATLLADAFTFDDGDALKASKSVVDAMKAFDANYAVLSSAVRLTGHLFARTKKVKLDLLKIICESRVI